MSLLSTFRQVFKPKPPVITLCHATRQRSQRALACRKMWLEAAEDPSRVEHIFAIDADDAESAAALRDYTLHVVSTPGLGCIGAWNTAAEHSTGAILVQLSDDWLPIPGWDRLFASHFPSLKKPGVLRISDGHRNDDLLCMAIMTRARVKQTGWFLPPAYTGVYSDDEYSFRAYEDGVVIEARDIVLVHDHPHHNPSIEMDETYRQQNDDSRYASAKKIFLERNPAAKKRWFVQGNWSERRWQPPAAIPDKRKKS